MIVKLVWLVSLHKAVHAVIDDGSCSWHPARHVYQHVDYAGQSQMRVQGPRVLSCCDRLAQSMLGYACSNDRLHQMTADAKNHGWTVLSVKHEVLGRLGTGVRGNSSLAIQDTELIISHNSGHFMLSIESNTLVLCAHR